MEKLQQPTVPQSTPEPLRGFLVTTLRALVTAVQELGRGPSGGVQTLYTLASGSNTIAHKLGRKPEGFVVGRCSAAMTVHSTDVQWGARTSQLVTVQASAAGDALLWFY